MAALIWKRCFLTLPANVSRPEQPSGWLIGWRRILGLLQRHVFLLLGSWPRLIELLYWPTLNMIVWGFLNFYLTKQMNGVGIVAVALLAGTLLWDILIRSQFSVLVSFMEELWSRNLGHIFVAPIRPLDYAGGLVLLSLVRTFIAMTPAFLFAWLFFGFLVLDFGLPFIAFYLNLAMTGWWCSFLLVALLFRFGLAAEWLAWMLSFILSPFVAVYYPVSVLPEWIQPLAWSLPPTYVFEGMRAIVTDQIVRWDYLSMATLLNFAFLAVSLWVYLTAFEATRRRSGLLQMGE